MDNKLYVISLIGVVGTVLVNVTKIVDFIKSSFKSKPFKITETIATNSKITYKICAIADKGAWLHKSEYWDDMEKKWKENSHYPYPYHNFHEINIKNNFHLIPGPTLTLTDKNKTPQQKKIIIRITDASGNKVKKSTKTV